MRTALSAIDVLARRNRDSRLYSGFTVGVFLLVAAICFPLLQFHAALAIAICGTTALVFLTGYNGGRFWESLRLRELQLPGSAAEWVDGAVWWSIRKLWWPSVIMFVVLRGMASGEVLDGRVAEQAFVGQALWWLPLAVLGHLAAAYGTQINALAKSRPVILPLWRLKLPDPRLLWLAPTGLAMLASLMLWFAYPEVVLVSPLAVPVSMSVLGATILLILRPVALSLATFAEPEPAGCPSDCTNRWILPWSRHAIEIRHARQSAHRNPTGLLGALVYRFWLPLSVAALLCTTEVQGVGKHAATVVVILLFILQPLRAALAGLAAVRDERRADTMELLILTGMPWAAAADGWTRASRYQLWFETTLAVLVVAGMGGAPCLWVSLATTLGCIGAFARLGVDCGIDSSTWALGLQRLSVTAGVWMLAGVVMWSADDTALWMVGSCLACWGAAALVRRSVGWTEENAVDRMSTACQARPSR